jgi:CHAT domain-containing protein
MKLPVLIFCLLLSSLFNNIYSQEWKVYSDSAKIFRDQKKTDQAIEYYNKAKDLLAKDSVYSNAYSQTCINIADIYNSTGQKNKIAPFYLEARKTIEKIHGKVNVAYAAISDRLGQFYLSTSPPVAETYFTEAMESREKQFGKESLEYAVSCNNIGNLYIATGQYKKAEIFHLQAKKIREIKLPKDDPAYAQSCNNLANIYWRMGEYETAEPLGLEAKRIREKIPPVKESPLYAITCTFLANLYRDMGQYEKAETLYIEAKKIREKTLPVTDDNYAASFIILADLYAYMGQYEKAEPLYLEVKQIREKVVGKESSAYALSCNNLGNLYSDMGQYEKAEALLLEAKDIWNKVLGKDDSYHAYNRNSLGQLYFSMGQYPKAETFFLEARQLWEKIVGKEHADYTQNTNNLARVYWNMDQSQKANEFYSQAFNTQYNLISKIFQFTNETEKELYLKNVNGNSDEYQSFYYKKLRHGNAGQPFSISLFSRNLILSSIQQTRQAIYTSNDTVLTKKYNDWTDLKQQLAKLYSGGIGPDIEQVKVVEEKANLLEKELTRLSAEFEKKMKQQKPDWKNIQQNLKPTEAAIEFAEFKYYDGKRWTDSTYYVALVLRKNIPEPELVPLFEKRQLDSLFKGKASNNESINSIYTRGLKIKRDNSTSRSAYNIIWKPLENKLKGVTRIYFAPAGLLHRIAFAALPSGNKSVLSDKCQLIQLASTASVANQGSDFVKISDKIYLYGGVQLTVDSTALKQAVKEYQSGTQPSRSLPDDLSRRDGFEYLPGTENEIDEIEKAGRDKGFSFRVFDSVAANEESVKALNGRSSPGVLHIATHGFFFPNPQKQKIDSGTKEFSGGKMFRQSDNPLFRSALLFAGANNTWNGKTVEGVEDGILTAYEVSNMSLPNTKLVVLSACETALGDIQGSEGVYGMQRAFKMAGVQNLVMSLWKVPDAETSEFMQEFYKNMFAGQSISDAFYNAQTIMKNKYRNEPYKWAAWVLIR